MEWKSSHHARINLSRLKMNSLFLETKEHLLTTIPARHRSSLKSKLPVKMVSGARKTSGWASSAGSAPCTKASPKSMIRRSSTSSSVQLSQPDVFTSCLGRPSSNGLPSSQANSSASGSPRMSKRSSLVVCDRCLHEKATFLLLISADG